MRLTIFLLVVLISARDGDAQVATPAGIARHATSSVALVSRDSPSPVWSLQADTDHKSPLWLWALGGAAAGAAIGGAVAARSVARSEDDFFPLLAIGYGIGAGALGGAALGALLGAIYNGVAHRESNN
jgi:hypothetical protein